MPFPPPGDFPNLGTEPKTLASPHWQADSLPAELEGKRLVLFSSVQSLSHPTLCDPMDLSTPGFPVHHQLPDYRCQAERDWASLVAQMVKNPPAVQEPWVQSLGWEDPLEEGMATHSSILA